jgi:hypothetical protein
MPNEISVLQAKFIDFARGMPAVAISWRQIKRDIDLKVQSLAGVNPAAPSPFLGNVRMPVHSLAFSVFVEALDVNPSGNTAELGVRLIANIHPHNQPDQVIRSYVIESDPTALIGLELDDTTNEVHWQEQGGSMPRITPDWGPDADAVLNTTSIPDPKRDNYLAEVERQIIWLTGPSFVRLVAGVLPRYRLSEIVPWLRLSAPLRIELASPHIVITSTRATLLVGDCTPEAITIEPDPAFPYGEAIPAPTLDSSDIELAVYAPKTRLFEFFAKKVSPAIMVSDSGGGVVKWSLAGSIGLKSIVIDLKSAQGLTGVIAIDSSVDFVAGARAWIDGPSGSKLSLASASVLGTGNFGADIQLAVDVAARSLEAVLTITHSSLPNVSWDIGTPLGWPLDQIAGEILNHVSRQEIQKLAGSVSRIGKWEVVGLPLKYLDTYRPWETPIAHSEGLAGVSAFMGVRRFNDG